MESSAFFGQKIVDLERAIKLDLKWEEIIEEMNNGSPNIPDRLVLKATKDLWDDKFNKRGLRSLMEREHQSQYPNWKILANKLSHRINNKYCISSDGKFPSGLCQSDIALFKEMQDKALDITLDRADRKLVLNNNDALRFLTWSFKLCKNDVTHEMLKALEEPIGNHPFVWGKGNRRLIYQGLGRSLYQKADIKLVFTHLLNIPSKNWNFLDHVACAAFLLSRRDSALEVLNREDVEKLANIGSKLLIKSSQSKNIRSNTILYPPYLMAGILRMRKKDVGDLIYREALKQFDPAAKEMFEAIKFALPNLKQKATKSPRFHVLVGVLEEVLKCLEGRGRPDILSWIDKQEIKVKAL